VTERSLTTLQVATLTLLRALINTSTHNLAAMMPASTITHRDTTMALAQQVQGQTSEKASAI
jgi:HAMP domain-containing protein